MDFVDIKSCFVSDKFKTIVVHLPQAECISWSISIDADQAINKAINKAIEIEINLRHELREKDNELKEKDNELTEKYNEKVAMILLMKKNGIPIKNISETANVTEDFINSID
jgi:hypothetical protein